MLRRNLCGKIKQILYVCILVQEDAMVVKDSWVFTFMLHAHTETQTLSLCVISDRQCDLP